MKRLFKTLFLLIIPASLLSQNVVDYYNRIPDSLFLYRHRFDIKMIDNEWTITSNDGAYAFLETIDVKNGYIKAVTEMAGIAYHEIALFIGKRSKYIGITYFSSMVPDPSCYHTIFYKFENDNCKIVDIIPNINDLFLVDNVLLKDKLEEFPELLPWILSSIKMPQKGTNLELSYNKPRFEFYLNGNEHDTCKLFNSEIGQEIYILRKEIIEFSELFNKVDYTKKFLLTWDAEKEIFELEKN